MLALQHLLFTSVSNTPGVGGGIILFIFSDFKWISNA